MSVQDAPPQQRNVKLIGALSNLSIQYNFSAIAIALAFMDNTGGNKSSSEPAAAYPRTEAQAALLKSLVFAGAIFGQLSMGYAGDVLGRRNAMLLTQGLSALGAIGSALFTWGSAETIYSVMGACRFVLGVGVGGKYPLTATMMRENERDEAVRAPTTTQEPPLLPTASKGPNPSIEVAKGFFWQTPGSMLPYVVALLLLLIGGKDNYGAEHMAATSFDFRLLLGLGAVPTLIVMLLTYYSSESHEYVSARTADKRGPLRVVRDHPELLGRLTGCGLSWLLYDFVYYGSSFNQVVITNAVFGESESLYDNCWHDIVLTSMGIPGVVLGIFALYYWSGRTLQAYGFLLQTAICMALAAAVLAQASNGLKFGIFCALLFSLSWGPNVSTYTLPTEIFPTAVRSTCFGVCAGLGKVGALIGSASFEVIMDVVGLDGVYLICAGVSVLGMLVTLLFVPTAKRLASEELASVVAGSVPILRAGDGSNRRDQLLDGSA